MNSMGTESGMNLGGGENEASSDGGNTQPEKEPAAEQQQQQSWNQSVWENMDYSNYGMQESWYPEYGAWSFTKEEPNEEWKVVVGKKNEKRSDDRMIGSLDQEEYEQISVDAVMDSGAFDTICPLEMIGGNEVRQTKASKAGMDYYAVNGAEIRNKGEVDLMGTSEGGMPIKFTSQVGEGVKKLLVSVIRAAKGGNMIVFGANLKAIKELAKKTKLEENLIMDTKTMVKSEIKEKRGMYVYPMTIRRKKKDPNAMDLSSVGRFESKNSFNELNSAEKEHECQPCNDSMEGLYQQCI